MERKAGILSGYTERGSYLPLTNQGAIVGRQNQSTICALKYQTVSQSCLPVLVLSHLPASTQNHLALPPSLLIFAAAFSGSLAH